MKYKCNKCEHEWDLKKGEELKCPKCGESSYFGIQRVTPINLKS